MIFFMYIVFQIALQIEDTTVSYSEDVLSDWCRVVRKMNLFQTQTHISSIRIFAPF